MHRFWLPSSKWLFNIQRQKVKTLIKKLTFNITFLCWMSKFDVDKEKCNPLMAELDLWTAAQLGFQLTHPNGWCSICIISRWTTLLTSMHIYMFKPSSGLTFGSLHHFTTGACWRNDCSRQTDYTIYVNDFNLHLTPQISTTFIVVHFWIWLIWSTL